MSAELITADLFHRVLMQPVLTDSRIDTLKIISGYATAAMASGHRCELTEQLGSRSISVDLVCGMAGTDGVVRSNHLGFCALQRKEEFIYVGDFACSYMPGPPAVHSKVYVWCQGTKPLIAFSGSANYTGNGFQNSEKQLEVMSQCSPKDALRYFNDVRRLAVPAEEADFEKDFRFVTPRPHKVSVCDGVTLEDDKSSEFYGCEKATLSLLTKQNTTGYGSGLNWGHRKDGTKRDPNQAYLSLRMPLRESGFFPEKGRRFQVITPDGSRNFTCVRAQQYGKGIETPQDNTELGLYFRRLLGLPRGAFVRAEDLERYGNSDVTFYKISDDTYVMDYKKLG